MKIVVKTTYVCELCGASYGSEKEALTCESRLVTQDKHADVGDIVVCTSGEGAGCKAKVIRTGVASMDYGHYYWEKYWHTVYVVAEFLNNTGTRMLLFDDYKVVS